MQRAARLKREMELFEERPPTGISCYPIGDELGHLEAQIVGGDMTPYKEGIFKLQIDLPLRFPFEPPKIRFVTPIYHPNIDTSGRICLDLLKMPPAGTWSPVLQLGTVLTSIQLLMAEPNPDDPLMADIAREFKYSRQQFEQNAANWTKQHAMSDRRPVVDENDKPTLSANTLCSEISSDSSLVVDIDCTDASPDSSHKETNLARPAMTLSRKRPANSDATKATTQPTITTNKIQKQT